jgi:ribose 5-phosphate isomerase A
MSEELKKLVGTKAADMVKTGMVVGLGTGSTAKYAIMRLGERIRKEKLKIIGISTSKASSDLAKKEGIPLSTLEEHQVIDLTIDGADEVDPNLDLIKGLGGALLWEKVIASCTLKEVIIIDDSKLVDTLGTKAPLPVEVLSFAWKKVQKTLIKFKCKPVLRMRDGKPFITDSGNYIIDCKFTEIKDPFTLEHEINNIPGVVENGLFLGLAEVILVGSSSGVEEIHRRKKR